MMFGADTLITVGALSGAVGLFVGRLTAVADHAARVARMPARFSDEYRAAQRARFGYTDGYPAAALEMPVSAARSATDDFVRFRHP